MKKMIFLILISLFMKVPAKGQDIALPKFQGTSVAVELMEFNINDALLKVSDGVLETYQLSFSAQEKKHLDFANIIAKIFNQLADQGYKVVSTTGSNLKTDGYNNAGTLYFVFQREPKRE